MERSVVTIDSQTWEEFDPDGDPEFHYRTSTFDLLERAGQTYPWHWHPEVECFCVRRGALTYHIQGEDVVFRQGDVGFVNSGVLHMVSPADAPVSEVQNHIFLPHMICGTNAAMEAKYVAPLTQNTAAPLLVFHAGSPEAERICGWMQEAHEAHIHNAYAHELVVRDCMSRAWALFVAHMPPFSSDAVSRDSSRLMTMLQYIGEHYAEKIELQALAEAAHISSKECERCFRKQIRMSPFDYITEYRLEKAAALLRGREGSITQIGQMCGFATTSYFGKRFRERYGVSPREYREGAVKFADRAGENG